MDRNVTTALLPVHTFRGTSSIEDLRRLTTEKPRWHPKATPFRLLTTLSFAGLAIVKAILIYQGSQIAPVAVEWICGTLLFIVCYILGIFEQDGRLSEDTYRWFYEYDTMELVWTFLERFQIDRPEYSTTELPDASIVLSRPLVTNYRLLVSATVLTLGMLKAVLAYGSQSDGATTVDWISGVVAMTGLYVIGLYESNNVNLLPILFSRNSSQLIIFCVYEAGLLLVIIPAVYLFALWLRFSKETFLFILRGHPEKLDLTTVDGSGQFIATMTNLIGTTLLGYTSLIPLLFAGFLFRRHLQRSSLIRRLFLALVRQCRLYRLVPATLITLPMQEIEDRGVFFLRYIHHIILHITLILVLCLYGFVLLGVSVRLLSVDSHMGVGFFFGSLIFWGASVLGIISMFRPLYLLRQTGRWRGEVRSLGFFC